MYDAYYGLTGRPFQLTPDPEFYFQSQTHRKALSYLGYGLAQGEGFIVITGEIGAGKTTLVGHLMQTIDRARLTAAQIVTTQVASSDLLHLVARSFGLETAGMDKAAVLKTIEQFLHSEARAGRRCLLIVDESQNLPVTSVEELRMLSNFQLGNQALLQIFLLGQPEFRDMVQDAPELEQLRQRVIATHHLSAMEASEIRPYIEHRLSKVGWNGKPEFSEDAIQALYAATSGIPRKVNALVSRVLLLGSIEQKDTIDGATVQAILDDLGDDGNRAKAPAPKREAPAKEQDDFAAEAFDAQPGVEQSQPLSVAAIEQAGSEPVEEYVAPYTELDIKMMVERISALEMRTSEQERAIRRTLAMLIEWAENSDGAAAMLQDRAA